MSTNAAVASTQRVRARDRDALVMSEVKDPRPDLVDDTLLWERLLKMAFLDHGDHWGTNPYAALHFMRCCGLRILYQDNGKAGYRLVPALTKQGVDPAIEEEDPTTDLGKPHGVGDDSQWVFEAHYKKDREAALVPHKDEVVAYLKRL